MKAIANIDIKVAGVNPTGSITVDGPEGSIAQMATLAVAQAGTLSTRTDDDEGTLTLTTGHTITTAAVADIYWTGGKRYGVTIGTVSVNSVPFSGGAGDNLPVQTTAITVCARTVITQAIAYATLEFLSFSCDTRATLQFKAANGAIIGSPVEVPAGGCWFWDGTGTNPLGTTACATIDVTHASSAAAGHIVIGGLYDSIA